MVKERIPDAVRTKVWDTYIGLDKGTDKCFCCNAVLITKEVFHCGHVKSEYYGGRVKIENLRPICAKCNSSMGKRNMVEFMEYYGFDFRDDFDGRYHKSIPIPRQIDIKLTPSPSPPSPKFLSLSEYEFKRHTNDNHTIELFLPKINPSA